MAQVKDPVCGMMLESGTAAGQSTFRDKTYYFCSEECLRQFEADPERYVRAGSAKEIEFERHEPPYTKTGPIVAPKFGSAGSGGAEYERLPEMHDEDETQ